ncbi:hypothetical protein niasHT_010029 [Heterodera trifolii]|uniref:non-specific protein-tyrosine kinase n=1 Tax=Heterodera trifolii TaxID=157864 RepID=A0ABD2M8J0_9BILA
MADEAEVDEELIDVLRETDLVKFQPMMVFDKQLTRIEHFRDVTDFELMSYGLSEPAVRRLRNAIDRKRKKRTKIFGGSKREKALIRLKRGPVEGGQNAMAFPSTAHLIAESEIHLMETLGEGNFSVVKRAIWNRENGAKMDCAVKILHEMSPAVRLDLASEISTMQRLRHQNLVQLFGVIFSEHIMMVIELCEDGSLLDRLRSQTKPRLLVTTLLNYAQQIASGMSFLESRKCLHRDLAARNVLLTHEEQVVKIGDFGLTRILKDNERLYIMSEPKKIPFSWSPPESLRFREFSHKSDVWAFGVTLWELFTFGEEPWAGHRAAEVLQFLESDLRLRVPDFCSREIYDIMKLCWQKEAEKRPKFSHLRTLLNDCQFMTMVCRSPNAETSKSQLNLSVDDELILIGQRDEEGIWYGQSVKSRNLGDFPRNKVSIKRATQPQTVKSAVNSSDYKKDISRPVAGSFIHTGHGDIRENKCWGHVDYIDEIYLKNPLITQNSVANSEQKMAIVPSLLMLDQKQYGLPLPVANTLQMPNELTDHQRIVSGQKLAANATLAIGSRGNSANELNSNRHSTAIEWLSDGQSQQMETKQSQKRMEQQTNQQIPFEHSQQQQKSSSDKCASLPQNKIVAVSKSKYDSAISIPRPNRFSNFRLTPPPISVGNFSVGIDEKCPQTISPFLEPKITAVSSMPSVLSTSSSKTEPTNTKNVHLLTKQQRPSSAHSLNGKETAQKPQRGTDDPFLVKDDVKTLASKLRYNDVHKANEFFAIDQSKSKNNWTNLLTDWTTNDRKFEEVRRQQSSSNVAVVQPFLNNQNEVEAVKDQCPPVKLAGSLLPPPSDLLLSGLGTSSAQIRHSDHLKCQPLFDISAPVSVTTNFDLFKPRTNNRQEKAEERQKEATAVSLSELDTDALLNRVKVGADFASFEQCRQILWHNAFDVEATIRQLKIEKLIEMGLATDRSLALSALDSEEWDVNAAANRLCCS